GGCDCGGTRRRGYVPSNWIGARRLRCDRAPIVLAPEPNPPETQTGGRPWKRRTRRDLVGVDYRMNRHHWTRANAPPFPRRLTNPRFAWLVSPSRTQPSWLRASCSP